MRIEAVPNQDKRINPSVTPRKATIPIIRSKIRNGGVKSGYKTDFSPQNMAYAHLMIIDYTCKMIRRK